MGTLAVIWRAGGLVFATGVEAVAEVLAPLACRPVPGVPGWVRGLFTHRGRLIPLVDAGVLMGLAAAPDRMSNRVIVVRVGTSPECEPWKVGLWVESVVEIEKVDFGEPGAHPGFETDAGRFLGTVAQTRWGPVQRVDPERLFTPEQGAVLSERLKEGAA